MNMITAAELDSIARLGLEDLRACFGSTASEDVSKRALFTLKLISQGTSRKNSELNGIALGLKVAKAVGLGPEDQRPLWEQIVTAGAREAQMGADPKQIGDPSKLLQKESR